MFETSQVFLFPFFSFLSQISMNNSILLFAYFEWQRLFLFLKRGKYWLARARTSPCAFPTILLGRVTKVGQSNIDQQEVTCSDFFYEDITCTARLHRKLRSIVGETISFLDDLGYIHVLCVIRWGPTYSIPSVHFSNRATSEKFIAYLLYSALYPCKHYTIYWTEDTLGMNIYVKEVR